MIFFFGPHAVLLLHAAGSELLAQSIPTCFRTPLTKHHGTGAPWFAFVHKLNVIPLNLYDATGAADPCTEEGCHAYATAGAHPKTPRVDLSGGHAQQAGTQDDR